MQRCVVCGDSRPHSLEPLAIVPDDPAYAGHRIARCNECGVRSSYPMPDREELRRWYSDGRAVPDDEREAGGIKKLWHQIHDTTLMRAIVRRNGGRAEGRLVDVGAGSGRLVRAARRVGVWHIIATELAEDSVRRLNAEGFDARLGHFDEVGIEDGSVDVVLASHLMEHLRDIEPFLSGVRAVLKPGGLLVALLPSEESLRARLGITTWHHVNPPGHLWGFRPTTFRRLLERNGFTVEAVTEVHAICEMVVMARREGTP